MNSFFMKIAGIEGDVTIAHLRGWHQLSAYVLTSEADTDPKVKGRWNGYVHTYDPVHDPRKFLWEYLNFELPVSGRVGNLFFMAQVKGAMPVSPADATLTFATNAGATLRSMTFSDVRIRAVTILPQGGDHDSVASVSLRI